jgi:hypothetical protein
LAYAPNRGWKPFPLAVNFSLKMTYYFMNFHMRVQACPGTTGCSYEIVFTVNGLASPSLHLNIPSLSQGLKDYNHLILLIILIKSQGADIPY